MPQTPNGAYGYVRVTHLILSDKEHQALVANKQTKDVNDGHGYGFASYAASDVPANPYSKDALILNKDDELDIEWMHRELTTVYFLSKPILGNDMQGDHEAKFMISTTRVTPFGIQIEGGPRHAEILINEWGMEAAIHVDTPMTHELTQLG